MTRIVVRCDCSPVCRRDLAVVVAAMIALFAFQIPSVFAVCAEIEPKRQPSEFGYVLLYVEQLDVCGVNLGRETLTQGSRITAFGRLIIPFECLEMLIS